MSDTKIKSEYQDAYMRNYMRLHILHKHIKLNPLTEKSIYKFRGDCYRRESLVNVYFGLEMWKEGYKSGEVLHYTDFECERLTNELKEIFEKSESKK